LLEICSLRLIGTTTTNPPGLKLGQGVLHDDLQTLHSALVDMHKLYKIEEVIEFQIRLIIKLNLKKNPKSGICARIARCGPLKQILPDLNNFFRFAQL
jgi:hypothetical protein